MEERVIETDQVTRDRLDRVLHEAAQRAVSTGERTAHVECMRTTLAAFGKNAGEEGAVLS